MRTDGPLLCPVPPFTLLFLDPPPPPRALTPATLVSDLDCDNAYTYGGVVVTLMAPHPFPNSAMHQFVRNNFECDCAFTLYVPWLPS